MCQAVCVRHFVPTIQLEAPPSSKLASQRSIPRTQQFCHLHLGAAGIVLHALLLALALLIAPTMSFTNSDYKEFMLFRQMRASGNLGLQTPLPPSLSQDSMLYDGDSQVLAHESKCMIHPPSQDMNNKI